jgi:hypothetical protein
MNFSVINIRINSKAFIVVAIIIGLITVCLLLPTNFKTSCAYEAKGQYQNFLVKCDSFFKCFMQGPSRY